ncbi:unnamed protein product [Lota lota]
MFRRDQSADSSSTPQLPPRPSERSVGVMEAIQKANPSQSTSQASTVKSAASQESLQLEAAADGKQSSGKLLGVIQKVNPFKSTSQASSTLTGAPSSRSLDQGGSPDPSQNPGRWQTAIQKMNPFRSPSQASAAVSKAPSSESLEQGGSSEPSQNPGVFVGMMQKVNPFRSTTKTQSSNDNLSSSTGSLTDNNNSTEKQNLGKFQGMMQKDNPFKSTSADPCAPGVVTIHSICVFCYSSSVKHRGQTVHSESSSSSDSLDGGTIERHSVWYTEENQVVAVKSTPTEVPSKRAMTFRIKRILPVSLFSSGTKEEVEEVVEVQTLQLAEAPEPGEDVSMGPLDDEEGLMSWWRTVEGWDEWNQSTQDTQAEEEVVEEAADRVFMAARLFVRLFSRRRGTLQRRVLGLLSLADAADSFHGRAVAASVGGGVASVAGSVTTVTGLMLAPFTLGTSLIVTAVGIGVATAGGLVSASANITDTVHSKMDRKKVEEMIQDYREDMGDISDCLQFLQDGMDAWDFAAYTEVIARSHLNQNVKHVVKEGGRAGKALLVNTESLVSTIQVLSVSGVAAKAAQVMSVTAGVMSALFLALDVFFLAKDSLELKKGAKTEFAVKIREVCHELQGGLLELNRIKEQLQKTMDGIEVEGGDDEEELRASVKKLIELEE